MTLRYHPSPAELPPGACARAASVFNGTNSDLTLDTTPSPRKWLPEAREKIGALVPKHSGGSPIEFYRCPDSGKMAILSG
ncbi:MAG: hypothetical protein OXL68_01260 [Paracoccaceae bacterium]|nr:hypothetical protein [Paracoccaceae bacterium]